MMLIKLNGGLGGTYRPEVPVFDGGMSLRETNEVESIGIQAKVTHLKPITANLEDRV